MRMNPWCDNASIARGVLTGLVGLALTGCGLVAGSLPGELRASGETKAFEGPVPRAACGPDDKLETALQGQVPLADRIAGNVGGAWCNLELIGNAMAGETGARLGAAYFEDCAYYRADPSGDLGAAIVDASDSRNPEVVGYLTTPAVADPHEGLEANEKRGLLAVAQNAGAAFDVYDISGDCRSPELLISTSDLGTSGHSGAWAPDGRTYFAASGSTITVVDVTDPSTPSLFYTIPPPWKTHDLSISADGTRAYLALPGRATPPPGDEVGVDPTGFAGNNGLAILDITDIHERKADPQVSALGELYWRDGGFVQQTLAFKVGGRPYMLVTDELSPYGIAYSVSGLRSCAAGVPPYGPARIIDISDETAPVEVAKLLLEVNLPENCAVTAHDGSTGGALRGYSAHYCQVDDPDDATIMVCPHGESGVRIFDIRDPQRPREIAYYVPPGGPAQGPCALQCADGAGTPQADETPSEVRINKTADGKWEFWYLSLYHDFSVIKLTRPIDELLGPPPGS